MNNTLFITGATGFIGHETVIEGVSATLQALGYGQALVSAALTEGHAPTSL